MPRKTYLDEMRSQPTVLRRCIEYYQRELKPLRRELRSRPPLAFTGMGASLYASLPAVYGLNQRGSAVRALDTAELVHYRLPSMGSDGWLVITSQSGETVEVIRLLKKLNRRRIRVVGITNEPDSTLGRAADVTLPLLAGPLDFASTKTYTASVLISLLLARVWGGASAGSPERLLGALERSLGAYERLLDWCLSPKFKGPSAFSRISYRILLGRGPSLASALGGALLFKEVCALPAEGLTGAQFRHGPLELLEKKLGVVVFAPPGPTHKFDHNMAAEILKQKSSVVWVSSRPSPARGAVAVPLPRPSDPDLTPLFEILPVQALTARLAQKAGRAPGKLRIATNVTLKE